MPTHSLSFRQRFVVWAILIGGLALAAFGVEWWIAARQTQDATQLTQQAHLLAQLSALETDLLEQSTARYEYLLTGDATAHMAAEQKTTTLEAAFSALLADALPPLDRPLSEAAAQFRAANTLYVSLASAKQNARTLDEDALAQFFSASEATTAALRTALEIQTHTIETLESAETRFAFWSRVVLILQVLLLASLVWGVWSTVRAFSHDIDMLANHAQIVGKALTPLADTVHAFANGDLDVTVDTLPSFEPAPVRFAEFAVVQNVFAETMHHVEEMHQLLAEGLAHLRDLIGNVTLQSAHLAQSGRELQNAAEQTGYATQQIAETMHQLSQGTVQQASDAATVAHAVEQIARAADGVAQGATEQVAAMQRTSEMTERITQGMDNLEALARQAATTSTALNEAATEGRERLDVMQTFLERMRTQIDETQRAVVRMDEQSEAISLIVRTIDEIADKTDILALNAAVEAARAGEQGRGFTVIAEQIRKLSEDAKRSTADITNLIRDVQHDMDATGQAVRAVGEAILSGLTYIEQAGEQFRRVFAAARETGQVSQTLYETVADVRQKVDSVANSVQTVVAITEENSAAAQEMSASIHEIRQAVESLASISEETSAGVQQVSASTEELTAQVEEMMAAAQQLAEMARALRESVGHYLDDLDEPSTSTSAPTQTTMPKGNTHTPQAARS